MKLKVIFLFPIFIFLIFPISPANSQENSYLHFVKLMQNYNEASNNLQMELVRSIFLIKDVNDATPDIDKIKTASVSLNKKQEAFAKKAAEINSFINKNEVKLKNIDDILRKIKADSSDDNIKIIKEFANAFSAFSETAVETTFTVYANEGWANSGINVNSGDLIFVDAKGVWKASPGYNPVGWKGYICNSSNAYNINKEYPLGALLFRVRGSTKTNGFILNDKKRGIIDSSGRLEFTINDSDRRNNEGQLKLTIIILKREAMQDLLNIFGKLNGSTNK